MFDLGMQELIVIFVVALLVFGPKKLPELGRTVGKAMGQLKKAMTEVKTEVDREMHIAQADLKLDDLAAWKDKDAGVNPKPVEDEEAADESAAGKDAPEDKAGEGQGDSEAEEPDYRDVVPEEIEDDLTDTEDKEDESTREAEA